MLTIKQAFGLGQAYFESAEIGYRRLTVSLLQLQASTLPVTAAITKAACTRVTNRGLAIWKPKQ